MLAKQSKLNLNKEKDKEIFNHKILETNNFNFFLLNNVEKFKASVVVPKKNIKKAVYRNQVRRKIYQIIQDSQIIEQKVYLLVMTKFLYKDFNRPNKNEIIEELKSNLQSI